jgi:hypothetical protein
LEALICRFNVCNILEYKTQLSLQNMNLNSKFKRKIKA